MATSAPTPSTHSSSTFHPPDPPLTDPWTPDQELTLLKALVKHKPIGLHAHFQMLSIRQALLTSGTCTSEDTHTRIPGIRAKLQTLYDMPRLEEREDAIGGIAAPTSTSGAPSTPGGDEDSSQSGITERLYWRDFELPRDGDDGGFEKLMWERRLAPEGTGSPEGRGGRRESTVAGTDEPRSSPVAVVGRGGRGGRRGGRVSRLKGEEVGEGRASRRGSKAASEVGMKDEDGDENMEDVDEEESSGDGEEESEESSEEEEEDEKRGPAKRGRGGRRGRGRRGRRRG